MALLAPRGFDTPSLSAQGGQRRFPFLNISRDISSPAMLKTIFAQETKAEAAAQWNVVADALREKQPKLGAMMDASREDVLAYMDFPKDHWPQISNTNPFERLNKGAGRCPAAAPQAPL
jgi:transposase-like protein